MMTLGAEMVDDRPPHGVAEALSGDPDPAFARELRAELRARQALATGRIWWFDIASAVGALRIAHDGQLAHLVTNDPAGWGSLARARFGFVPGRGESAGLRAAIEAVMAGRRRGSEVAYLGGLGDFQRSVLRATARIPRGEVRTYGWVAREAGVPGAVRAAGTALGHNPVPFIVPCHRVVKADWQLGRYSAAGGSATKGRILGAEGLDLARMAGLSAAGVRYQGSRNTHIFCMPSCHTGKHLQPANLVSFRSEAEARREGYRPCLVCRPA